MGKTANSYILLLLLCFPNVMSSVVTMIVTIQHQLPACEFDGLCIDRVSKPYSEKDEHFSEFWTHWDDTRFPKGRMTY